MQTIVRIAAAPCAAAVVVLGVRMTGGVLTDDAVAAGTATAGCPGLALVAVALGTAPLAAA